MKKIIYIIIHILLNILAGFGLCIILDDFHLIDFNILSFGRNFMLIVMFSLPLTSIVMLVKKQYIYKLLGLVYLIGTFVLLYLLDKALV